MKGKFDEKLAQLAFGDLSSEEATRIEAQAKADPEAARHLDTYRSMKMSLKAMSDVPEDQMSKERLRDAILAQGLNPKPQRSSNFGWLWMPATAAILAVGLMVVRNRTIEPAIALDNHSISSDVVAIRAPAGMKTDLTPSDLTANVLSTTKNFNLGSDLNAKPSEPRSAGRSGFRLASRSESHRQEPVLEYTPFSEAPKEHVPNNEADPDANSNQTDSSSPATSGTPIVMIDENRDSNTGARIATEVGASNVLIGG